MHTIQEQVKLWANTPKRKEFLKNYKDWGVWFTVDQLDLVFYKYDLNSGGRIIVLEFKRPFYHPSEDEQPWCWAHKMYFQDAGKPFQPMSQYDGQIEIFLKDEKVRLQQELRQQAKRSA